ncbi:MAG TPA: hypothetical protein PLW81_00555 [Thiobacillaceae bacterium]|nr:hypothetical protein [Thiobacillaceae bacterium]
MATRLIWVKVKADVIVDGRELRAGQVTEVTPAEFAALVREKAAVPCGEGGRMLTADRVGTDMRILRG